jgi:hypothetical protein
MRERVGQVKRIDARCPLDAQLRYERRFLATDAELSPASVT